MYLQETLDEGKVKQSVVAFTPLGQAGTGGDVGPSCHSKKLFNQIMVHLPEMSFG